MAGRVLDFSTRRFVSTELKAAGLVGLCRYQWITAGTRETFNRAKAITRPEYDGHIAAGLSVALNCQVDKDDYLGGFARGVEYGRLSLIHSREMGHPDSRPVILTVQDQAIPTANYGLATEYMRGFVVGRGQGPQAYYGGTDIGNLCVNAGHAKFIWRSMSMAFSTQPSNAVALAQTLAQSYPQWNTNPRTYDENDVLKADWGQHPFGGSSVMLRMDD